MTSFKDKNARQANRLFYGLTEDQWNDIPDDVQQRLNEKRLTCNCTKQVKIHLYHGRKHPDENMQDWGFDGPTIGPFDAVIFTYLTDIRGFKDGHETTLKRHDDMVVWDNNYYGDFEVIPA